MTLGRRGALTLVAAGVSAAMLALALPARESSASARKPQVDVIQIQASQVDGGGSIDPKLAGIDALTQEPLKKSFNTFVLLDRKSLPLEAQKASSMTLVDGAVAQLTMLEPADRGRYKLHLELGTSKVDFTTDTGSYAIIGPFTYQDARFFVAITIKP